MNITVSSPQNLTGLLDLSMRQFEANAFEQSLASSQQVLMQDLASATAWNNAAAALAKMGRWVDALAYIRQALNLDPYRPDSIHNGAQILLALGRADEASALYKNWGWVHYQQAKEAPHHNTAIAHYQQALAIQPNDPDGLHILAGLLSERGDKEAALALMDRALQIDPHHLNTLAAKGNLLGTLNRGRDEIDACFQLALSVDPRHWMTLYNYGVFLSGAQRYAEAIEMYSRACQADPEHHLPFWNLSNLLLKLGDYRNAWPLYEWRWKTKHLGPSYLKLPMPLWVGQDLRHKRILLHFEQGYGDAFQFIRFAKDIAARGAHVTVFMPQEICEALIGVEGVHEIRPWNIVPQGFDYHAPLMSLPAPLGLTTETIPNQVPYLFPRPERVALWQHRLPPKGKNQKWRIGLAWCGRITHDNDRNRSMAFAQLLPLIHSFPQVQFVSMQVGARQADLPTLQACPELIRLDQDIKDFSDTAAIASTLDLLISVDTSVVHLVAALGKPVWALIPAASDWRWLLEREDTPWYPNVRLFRQTDEEGKHWNWNPVLTRVQNQLAQLLATA